MQQRKQRDICEPLESRGSKKQAFTRVGRREREGEREDAERGNAVG